MIEKKQGFTLIEVLISVIIFAIGILSMSALGALNFMYIRVNQERAKLHILTESAIENMQQWAREPAIIAPGPTRFDNLFYTGTKFDLLKTFASGNCTTFVYFDDTVGAEPSSPNAKIFLGITSIGISGYKPIKDSVYFCLTNYGIGE